MELALATPSSYQKIMTENPILIIPVGAMEWHDEHLPFGLDYLKIEQVAIRIAEKVGGFSAPVIQFGYPKNFADHPVCHVGTFCPEFDALYNYIFALGKVYVDKGFKILYFLSGHYERAQVFMLKLISRRLVEYAKEKRSTIFAAVRMEPDFTIKEGISKMWKEDEAANNCKLPFFNGDHAGFYETSLALYLCPETVKKEKIDPQYYHPDAGPPTAEWGKTWTEIIVEKAGLEISGEMEKIKDIEI